MAFSRRRVVLSMGALDGVGYLVGIEDGAAFEVAAVVPTYCQPAARSMTPITGAAALGTVHTTYRTPTGPFIVEKLDDQQLRGRPDSGTPKGFRRQQVGPMGIVASMLSPFSPRA